MTSKTIRTIIKTMLITIFDSKNNKKQYYVWNKQYWQYQQTILLTMLKNNTVKQYKNNTKTIQNNDNNTIKQYVKQYLKQYV